MSRHSTLMNSLCTPTKAFVVTAMALLLSHVVIYDLMSVSFFSPMEKASDFRFSDFYTLVANDRAIKTLDSDIVIVPVDGCNRREIAHAVDDIDFCAPAAVGLDMAFSAPSDPTDDPLAQSLATCARLVMPVIAADNGADYTVNHISYYDSVVQPSGGFAAVNIQGEHDAHATVREFTKSFLVSGEKIRSLPAALAAIARPEAVRQLDARNNDDEAICYVSREFETIYPDEIIDNADMIKGKIVLVGKLRDAADLHTTPLNNFTPGLLIHAYTTATILSSDFTRRLTTTETYVIAGILCYLVVWLNLLLSATPLGTLAVRGIQIILLYLMILGGTAAYIRFNIDLNFAYAMLTTSLGVATCDVFDGLFADNALIDRLSRYCQQIRQRYEHNKTNSDRTAGGTDITDTDGIVQP